MQMGEVDSFTLLQLMTNDLQDMIHFKSTEFTDSLNNADRVKNSILQYFELASAPLQLHL